ncbi:hypothetical protein Tco_1525756 [Tanacetum coccineum]
MYHDLYLGGKALVERENAGFDLTKSDLCLSFVKYLTAKGVGLCVVDSHTGNHRKDDFTPLETIQMFLGIIGSRSLSSSKGRPSSRRRGLRLVQALKKEEFSDFLSVYPIPSEYKVMLPKRNQTIFDTPDGSTCPDSIPLATPNLLPLSLCAKRMAVSLLYPINVWTFPDPILFLAGLKTSWEQEMAFRNFMFAEDDEDLSFLPKEPCSFFTVPSRLNVSINPTPLVEAEPLDEANTE